MEKNDLINRIKQGLHDIAVADEKVRNSPTQLKLAAVRKDIAEQLKEMGDTNDIGLILQVERRMIENEREIYSYDPVMCKIFDNIISAIAGAENAYRKVHDPISYQEIDNIYQSHKSRIHGLPNDEARQFFKSQSAHLLSAINLCRDESKQQVFEARRANMIAGGTAYIELQKQALGLI
ncbi:MAG: hypothetical protein AB8B77_01850 [Alphaproteobacteria bacterium]